MAKQGVIVGVQSSVAWAAEQALAVVFALQPVRVGVISNELVAYAFGLIRIDTSDIVDEPGIGRSSTAGFGVGLGDDIEMFFRQITVSDLVDQIRILASHRAPSRSPGDR